jgi:Phasin protein
MSKRELPFCSNHWRRARLPSCQTKGTSNMSNAHRDHSNQNPPLQEDGNEQMDAGTASSTSFPGGFQALATAYGDYTKKSFEDTRSFVKEISGVKSLEKAIEIQTEFAKTAYETFVTQSQKIGSLYGDLAKQSYKPFAGFVTRTTLTNR